HPHCRKLHAGGTHLQFPLGQRHFHSPFSKFLRCEYFRTAYIIERHSMDNGGCGLRGSGEPARWNAEDSHDSGLLSQWGHATELVCHCSGALKLSWNPSTQSPCMPGGAQFSARFFCSLRPSFSASSTGGCVC